MKKQALILLFNDPSQKNIFIEHMNKKPGVQAKCVLKRLPIPLRALRRLHLLSGLPGVGIWFSGWKAELFGQKLIICIATEYSSRVLRWIYEKTDSRVRLIQYFWDEIHISGYPVAQSDRFENWSFCRENCKEFGMKYNPQFWIESMLPDEGPDVYDISYVGGDRNGKYVERTAMVQSLYQMIKDADIKAFFWYLSDSKLVQEEIRKQEGMSHKAFFDVIRSSKVVVDLVETETCWLTQRTLLALASGKRLVTNNMEIMKEPFYQKENIFVIGLDSYDALIDFIKKPYGGKDASLYQQYEMTQWLERFMGNENIKA